MYNYVIIDDESLIRRGTIKKLQPMNDVVTCIGEAGDGAEGLRLVEELAPDFVILDMQMPAMNGMELLPILAERFPDLQKIVISGFRDFDYIKQAISSDAIDYLLKPFSKEALQDCVRTAIKRIEDTQLIHEQIMDSSEQREAACYEYDKQYLTNLILGYHTGDAAISSQKLNFINDTHQLELMTLYFGTETPDIDIQEWLEDGGFGDLALYLSNTSMPDIGFLVLFMPNNHVISANSLTRQVADALLSFAASQHISLQIGISQLHNDLTELHQAFDETSTALNRQPVQGALRQSFLYEEEPAPKQMIWDREDEFLFRVEAGMLEEISSLSDVLFDWLSSLSDFTLADAKYYCYTLSNKCRLILNTYLKQDDSKSSGSMQNVVSHIFKIGELKSYYRQFFLNIGELLQKDTVYALDDTVEKIKIYIQKNYQKDLTQDFIACLFYLNRSYLSTLFKQKTGMKFIDYLNEVRIGKAKELLLNSDRKMYQIAKACGYDNTKYFFRVFKKVMGVTPEQYRNVNVRK